MRNILVTGGAGFIGSHLCEALLARGDRVTCLDNFSTGAWENIQHLAGLQVIEGDVNDAETWDLLRDDRYAAVFHYAATVGVRRTEEHPSVVLTDILGLRHVASLASAGQAQKVIYSSSSEVYGEPRRIPAREEDGNKGWSPYATVKLYGEHLFSALWQERGIATVSLRFFNVYGPRQRGSAYGFVAAHFLEQALAGEAPSIFGTGRQTRDFVHVADNVRAALAALDRPQADGQILNIGSGRETAIGDLAQAAIHAAGRSGALQPTFFPARAREITRRCASVEKMKAVLDLSCTTSLEDGLRNTVRALHHADLPMSLPQVVPHLRGG